jgi:hypothetical protein
MNAMPDILLPTAYFPPVSYFAYLANSNSAIIEQMETYPRQTYRNRCEILTSAGKLKLVVPVSKPNGNHTLTKDIQISYREPWNHHHWKSIKTAYRSSPYFNYYSDILGPVFESEEMSLIIRNNEMLTTCCRILKIKIKISFTDDYIRKPAPIPDLRDNMKPNRNYNGVTFPVYPQVFSHKAGFMKDLSILDLIFNKGPEATDYLKELYPLLTDLNTQ